MSQIDVPLSRSGFGQTQRPDNWWVPPLVVFLGLSAFIVYSTWAALQGQHFGSDPISHRFIRPNCSAPPTRVGLDQTQAGCRSGSQERC